MTVDFPSSVQPYSRTELNTFKTNPENLSIVWTDKDKNEGLFYVYSFI